MDKTMNQGSKVGAVVVTRNRKELLLKCLNGIISQSIPPEAVFIIDNASEDGTEEALLAENFITELPDGHVRDFLTECNKDGLRIIYTRLSRNLGGAGGFHEGIKMVYSSGYEWIWIMDDDTIPEENALAKLLSVVICDNKVGFVCSNVLWADDTPHLMNIPQVKTFVGGVPFNRYLFSDGVLCVEACSFVSVILNRNAVKDVGLPIKEFFIWGDDLEYTARITNSGYLGLFSPSSIVHHETDKNYCADLIDDSVENLWKHAYGIRNRLFMLKKDKGISFIAYFGYHILNDIIRVILYRKRDKIPFLKMILKAYWHGLFFSPSVIRRML